MKMPNMANGRDGFPCALNPVGDIFKPGIPPFEMEASIALGEASQGKKVLVGQIADSANSSRLFRREMRFWLEMPKDLYHLYQMNKLDCISEGYTGTGHLSICTKPVPLIRRGEASSELVKAATCKAKGNSRSQSPFFLAGLRGQMLGSVKVTASDSAEVTVSMTSGDSAGYGTMRGVCPDNLLNIKADSAFFQAAGKEKGPAVSQALLSTSMISGTGKSNELHHNSHLQATGNLAYSRHQHLKKTGAGFSRPSVRADRISRSKVRFFYVRFQRCAPIMVRRNGGASALAGFSDTGRLTPIRLATPFSRGERGSKELVREATTMATAYTRPEFIDTYWIIPEYETTPYGKVSFTRQERRTFIAMFKDSRLVWAGRQPMSAPTKYVKRMRSSKVCLKDPESEKLSVKDPVTPTITNIVTVQGVAHV